MCKYFIADIVRYCLLCRFFCNSDIFSLYSEEEEESEEEGEDPTLDSLSQAIAFQVSVHLIQDFAHDSLSYII